jgi:alanine racemase
VRHSWIEVDLEAIRSNVAEIVSLVAPAEVCAVVKANAYGHGDVPVANAALAGGATRLAVALVEEGARLRDAEIEVPILLLSEPRPGDGAEAVQWGLTPTVYTTAMIEELAAVPTDAPVAVHLKVDTGMHRVGATPDAAVELAARIVASQRLTLEGLWTHFAVAEDDAEFTKRQLEQLLEVRDRLATAGIEVPLLHAANTPGALTFPEARLDFVRSGLAIYGLRPLPGMSPDVELRPAMRVVSEVSAVRRLPAGARPAYGRTRPLPNDAWVATVPIGYADGVPRRLGQVGGAVLIGGKSRPFAGTVTMDQLVIDCGDDEISVGDEVVLIGEQGGAAITVDDWAEALDTINYEIVCNFGARLPRRFGGRHA